MYASEKTKKRCSWFLSKIDFKLKTRIQKEANKRGISAWLLTEYLLKSALGMIPDETPAKIFKR